MNRRQYATVIVFSISLLTVALIPLSGQQGSSYNPWLDYDDSGIIDVEDLHALGQAYGTSGTSLSLPMALEYDSGWIDISDQMGENITVTHNLDLGPTAIYFPRIYGRTLASGAIHQKHLDGTGYKPGWDKSYGKSLEERCGYSVVETSDGGYAIAGYRYPSSTLWDMWLVKIDSLGNHVWNSTFGGTSEDWGYSAVQTSDGGYALVGYTYSYGAGLCDVWLIKTDASGNHLWNRTHGGTDGDLGYCMVATGDGGYAIAGSTYSYGVGTPTYSNSWLVKTDANGIAAWNKTYGGPETSETTYSLIQTSDGGYAMAGSSATPWGPEWQADFWLVKTDALGNMQWNKTYAPTLPGEYRASSVIQTDDEGFMLVGYSDYYGGYMVKTNAVGDKLWDSEVSARLCSVVQTIDGYALGGYAFDYQGYERFWLAKVKSDWSLQWSKNLGGGHAYSMIQTSDGGYVLAGEARALRVVRTDPCGLTEDLGIGLSIVDYTADAVILYRGNLDSYWNYARVRIWVVKENP